MLRSRVAAPRESATTVPRGDSGTGKTTRAIQSRSHVLISVIVHPLVYCGPLFEMYPLTKLCKIPNDTTPKATSGGHKLTMPWQCRSTYGIPLEYVIRQPAAVVALASFGDTEFRSVNSVNSCQCAMGRYSTKWKRTRDHMYISRVTEVVYTRCVNTDTRAKLTAYKTASNKRGGVSCIACESKAPGIRAYRTLISGRPLAGHLAIMHRKGLCRTRESGDRGGRRAA